MRVVHLAVSACVVRAVTKKGHQLFEKKSAPLQKILVTPIHAYARLALDITLACLTQTKINTD